MKTLQTLVIERIIVLGIPVDTLPIKIQKMIDAMEWESLGLKMCKYCEGWHFGDYCGYPYDTDKCECVYDFRPQ